MRADRAGHSAPPVSNAVLSRTLLLYLLSLDLCVVGFMHLLSPDFFVSIIPAALPDPEWLNVLAGLAEIVIGVYLLEPRTRIFAAWGAIAVFPADVNMLMAERAAFRPERRRLMDREVFVYVHTGEIPHLAGRLWARPRRSRPSAHRDGLPDPVRRSYSRISERPLRCTRSGDGPLALSPAD